MSNSFEGRLGKGTVFSVGVQRWTGVCFSCKKSVGKSNISDNMQRIMLTKRAVVWVICPYCKQQHEVIGITP